MTEKPRLPEKKPDKKELFNFWFFNSKSQLFFWTEFIEKHNLTNLEKILIPYLVSRSFDSNKPNTCFPSQATITQELRISKKGLYNAIISLKKRKWLVVITQKEAQTPIKNKANFYILGKFKRVFLKEFYEFSKKLEETSRTTQKTNRKLSKELNKKRMEFIKNKNKVLQENDPDSDYSSLIGLALKKLDYNFEEVDSFIMSFISDNEKEYGKDDFAEKVNELQKG